MNFKRALLSSYKRFVVVIIDVCFVGWHAAGGNTHAQVQRPPFEC